MRRCSSASSSSISPLRAAAPGASTAGGMRPSFLFLALLACATAAAGQDDNPTLLRYFGERWFAPTTQGILEGAARWNVNPGFALGAQLAYEQGPNDEDPGASVGAHAEWEGKLGPSPVLGLV